MTHIVDTSAIYLAVIDCLYSIENRLQGNTDTSEVVSIGTHIADIMDGGDQNILILRSPPTLTEDPHDYAVSGCRQLRWEQGIVEGIQALNLQ